LDELPEFPRRALEALREPLETGHITLSRAAAQADFPARFQLVAAMNPCPCGYLGATHKTCRCTPDQVARYQSKLSGPLLDRIDLQIEVPMPSPTDLMDHPHASPELNTAESSTTELRAQCLAAHTRALQRQGCVNQALTGQALREHAPLGEPERRFLEQAAVQLAWSARSLHRVQRVARTIADLADAPRIERAHLAEAIQYRRALRSGS